MHSCTKDTTHECKLNTSPKSLCPGRRSCDLRSARVGSASSACTCVMMLCVRTHIHTHTHKHTHKHTYTHVRTQQTKTTNNHHENGYNKNTRKTTSQAHTHLVERLQLLARRHSGGRRTPMPLLHRLHTERIHSTRVCMYGVPHVCHLLATCALAQHAAGVEGHTRRDGGVGGCKRLNKNKKEKRKQKE